MQADSYRRQSKSMTRALGEVLVRLFDGGRRASHGARKAQVLHIQPARIRSREEDKVDLRNPPFPLSGLPTLHCARPVTTSPQHPSSTRPPPSQSPSPRTRRN